MLADNVDAVPPTISAEALEALRSLRSPPDGCLADSRLYANRRVSTVLEGRTTGSSVTRRSVDLATHRVSLSQAIAAVSPRSVSNASSSSRDAVPVTHSPTEASSPSLYRSAVVPSPVKSTRPTVPHQAVGAESSPPPLANTRPTSAATDGAAPTGRVGPNADADGTNVSHSSAPTFAQKFKRRVDALGALNENGAGLNVRHNVGTGAANTPNPAAAAAHSSLEDTPVPSRDAATRRPTEESLKTTMQLFFEAEDGRGTVQRPGDFRRRVHVSHPTKWVDDDDDQDSTSSSSESVSD